MSIWWANIGHEAYVFSRSRWRGCHATSVWNVTRKTSQLTWETNTNEKATKAAQNCFRPNAECAVRSFFSRQFWRCMLRTVNWWTHKWNSRNWTPKIFRTQLEMCVRFNWRILCAMQKTSEQMCCILTFTALSMPSQCSDDKMKISALNKFHSDVRGCLLFFCLVFNCHCKLATMHPPLTLITHTLHSGIEDEL